MRYKTTLGGFIFITKLMAQENNQIDITSISFEELLQTEYILASDIANQISNSSSAVSVVTALDIKRYGYKNLGEILNSMRGLHTFQSYGYTFLGGRGYGTPGDYAGRIILLIDGYKANESFFGQAFFEEDALLDVSQIKRVEYIPGGNSSGYSDGALLGAINIITKSGSDIDGTQVAYGFGSHNTHTKRATFGKKLDNGLDVLLSASTYDTKGRDFTYIDTITGDEVKSSNNNAENNRIFLKASYEGFSFETASVKSQKHIPTYPFTSIESELPIIQTDNNKFFRLKYDKDITQNTKISLSFWQGEYQWEDYDSATFISWDGIAINETKSKWKGNDIKLVGTWFENHTLSLGAEYRNDYGQEFYSRYIDPIDSYYFHRIYDSRKTYSTYIYDNYTIFDNLTFNYGTRYDKSSYGNKATSPQIALLWDVTEDTLLKLSTGITNRQTTMSEESGKELEKAKKNELVIAYSIDDSTKILTSLYEYKISNRLGWMELSDIDSKGAEIELEKSWENGTHFRTSYAYQKSTEIETNSPLVNTPNHLAKINLSIPLVGEKLRASWEINYVGKRFDNNQEEVSSHFLTNVNLLSHNYLDNTDISFKVKNLMDKKQSDIIGELWSGEKTYPQDGRTFWLEVEYKF